MLLPVSKTKSFVVDPATVTPPVPLMSLATSSVPVRAKRSVPLFTTSPVPSVPVAPFLPICNVPALMTVGPA